MQELQDKVVQALILKALKDNPKGLSEKQIYRYVKKKMKYFAELLVIMKEFEK